MIVDNVVDWRVGILFRWPQWAAVAVVVATCACVSPDESPPPQTAAVVTSESFDSGNSAAIDPAHSDDADLPPAELVITVSRTSCLGSCPVVVTELRSDGTVKYNGVAHVAVVGERILAVDRDVINAVWARLVEVQFMSLKSRYAVRGLRDAPSVVIAVHSKSVTKSVTNVWVNDPPVRRVISAQNLEAHELLDALASEIENMAGTAKLIHVEEP
jgi:hypothetical protein